MAPRDPDSAKRKWPVIVTVAAVLANACHTAVVSNRFADTYAALGHAPAFPNHVYTELPAYAHVVIGFITAGMIWRVIARIRTTALATLVILTVWLVLLVNLLILSGSSMVEVMKMDSGLNLP